MAELNRIHVSPGVYSSLQVDMKAAANSLGITKLGLVGETLKGPAFQPYWIHSPKEYATVFGGTSTKKFDGSNYPQYELPYIAKEYLKSSRELCVVRTLGFSGYNAGPAWAITGQKEGSDQKYVIAILRSRGTYKYRSDFGKMTDANGCPCQSAYDSVTFDVGEKASVTSCDATIEYNKNAVVLTNYKSIDSSVEGCDTFNLNGTPDDFSASYGNLGRFTIKCIVGPSNESAESSTKAISIPVSLNKADKDYILKVLGTSNDDGDQPLFVESLYDVAWEDLVVNKSFNKVNKNLEFYQVGYAADFGGLDPVTGILTKYEGELSRKDVGKRYLCAKNLTNGTPTGIKYYAFNYTTGKPVSSIAIATTWAKANGTDSSVQIKTEQCFTITDGTHAGTYINKETSTVTLGQLVKAPIFGGTGNYNVKVAEGAEVYVQKDCEEGYIYTVATITDPVGKKHYVYKAYDESTINLEPDDIRRITAEDKLRNAQIKTNVNLGFVVYNYEDGLYYKKSGSNVIPVECDLNDYKSQYRYSSTPWVVSNAKGDADNIVVNRLFRFHTISDGAGSLDEVKVSIENIRPDSGEFDVVVRAYNDIDSATNVLERFSRCSMAKGSKFIGYKIGTLDGQYESKSNFITVEVADTTAAMNSVPAGFLGYNVPVYSGATMSGDAHNNVSIAPIAYNTVYDEDVPKRKQYFGLSERAGFDIDYFTYKGKMATLDDAKFVSHGFHLDCRLNKASYSEVGPKISVDGDEGYIFDTVDVNQRTASLDGTPIISTEEEMQGCIYEDIRLRKFTLMFAGGFDGWDAYRDQRTNTDDFAYTNYKGYINTSTGSGYSFDMMNDASNYGIEGAAITSDYYATLAGVSLLKNPEEVDINVLATPGIDTINNQKLVNEVFDILEDRADVFYFPTTPDKNSGSGDFADEIPPVDEIVADFNDKELVSDYSATYYPWVKIEDDGEYIWLPVTKDIVRNIAESDNGNTTMNLAPAGTTRGKVDAIRARRNLKNGESDELYGSNINPVRTFAKDGIIVMGQKTLRAEDDLLNRVDVMRMYLRMKKLISIACLGLIFEPNDDEVVKQFKSIINGVMKTFVDNRAIEKWYMDLDTSAEARDRLELNATIYFKPVKALEYINLNFVVTDNDIYFTR